LGLLDHPSSRQQDKASFRLWKFDDLQSDPIFFGCLSRSITRVASIDEGNFDRLSGGLLNRLGKLTHLSTVLLIGRSHQQTQEVAQRIDGCMHFTALASLGSIITRMVATDRGVDCKVRLSKMAAEGCRLRPLASRSNKRRSSTRAVKQPAANQRWVC
jgi:hypothetical protein